MAEDFERFYTDLKDQESEDSVLTSELQLDRLLRPGSTYLNLNPFEVLQIPKDTHPSAAKKKYRKLSLLIHPDKNPDDRERAAKAFDILKKAMAMMEDKVQLAKAKDCYKEGEARLAIMLSEKRRKARNERGYGAIDEDDPKAYRKALWVIVTKVFADRVKKQKMLEFRAEEEKKLNAEAELESAEKRKHAEEFAKNYEDVRYRLVANGFRLNEGAYRSFTACPSEIKSIVNEIVDDLNALEAPINALFEVVEHWRDVVYEQVRSMQQHRTESLDRLIVRFGSISETVRMKERVRLNVHAYVVSLCSFDDLPCLIDKLRGEHAKLVELNMVTKQQQTVIDQLNHSVSMLRQHVARTRLYPSTQPWVDWSGRCSISDVDGLEEEVQHLKNQWENVQSQLTERLRITEQALQIQMVYRGEYDREMAWLDRVEETINKLRKPSYLSPEQYQQQLDLLVAEYAQLQERTAAIENVNREGGKFIREAKGYDGRVKQYGDSFSDLILFVCEFQRTHPQPKNGAQIVTEELEALNRRFSSMILEKRSGMQVIIQNWKMEKQREQMGLVDLAICWLFAIIVAILLSPFVAPRLVFSKVKQTVEKFGATTGNVVDSVDRPTPQADPAAAVVEAN